MAWCNISLEVESHFLLPQLHNLRDSLLAQMLDSIGFDVCPVFLDFRYSQRANGPWANEEPRWRHEQAVIQRSVPQPQTEWSSWDYPNLELLKKVGDN